MQRAYTRNHLNFVNNFNILISYPPLGLLIMMKKEITYLIYQEVENNKLDDPFHLIVLKDL